MQNLVSLLQDFYTIIVNIHLKVANIDFPTYSKINQFRILILKYRYTSTVFFQILFPTYFLMTLLFMIKTGSSFLIRAMRMCFYFTFKNFLNPLFKILIPKIKWYILILFFPLIFILFQEKVMFNYGEICLEFLFYFFIHITYNTNPCA